MRPSLRFAIAAALMALCARVPASMAEVRDQPNVDSLLRHLDDLYRSKSSIARIEIDVTTARSTRNMRLRAWTRGEDEVLVLIEAPPREAGTATLRLGNNRWNYLPKIDNGPGIPGGIREKIFTPFFTTKSHGSRLGLPTAKRIIDAHDGQIVVDCPPAGGTAVVVRLPIGNA